MKQNDETRLIQISLERGGKDHLKGFSNHREEPRRIIRTILQQFPNTPRDILIDIQKKLKSYAQCEWSDNLLEGHYIRYIPVDENRAFTIPNLRKGGVIMEVLDDKVRLKSTQGNRFWWITLNKNIIFRLLKSPEWIILAAMARQSHQRSPSNPRNTSTPQQTDHLRPTNAASNNVE